MILKYLGPYSAKDGSLTTETVALCKCDWCESEWQCQIRTLKRYKNKLPLGSICRACTASGPPIEIDDVMAQYPSIKKVLEIGTRGGVTTSCHVIAECGDCHQEYETKFEIARRSARCNSCTHRHGKGFFLAFPSDYPEMVFVPKTLGHVGQIKARTIVVFDCPECSEPSRSMWCNHKNGLRMCRRCTNGLPSSSSTNQKISEAAKARWATSGGREKYISSREDCNRNYTRTTSRPHRELKLLMDEAGLINFKSEQWVCRGIRVDEVDFGNKIVVELNGDYFHANPARYKPDNIVSYPDGIRWRASEIWKRENERIKKLHGYGYTVVIIWESELKKLGYRVLERIQEATTWRLMQQGSAIG